MRMSTPHIVVWTCNKRRSTEAHNATEYKRNRGWRGGGEGGEKMHGLKYIANFKQLTENIDRKVPGISDRKG